EIECSTRVMETSWHLIPETARWGALQTSLLGLESSTSTFLHEHLTVVDPLTAKAYTSRGIARLDKHDLDGAMSDLNQAIAIHPGLAEAYADRGSVRYEQGDPDGAIADWTRALQINPKLGGVYYNRGAVKAKVGELQ